MNIYKLNKLLSNRAIALVGFMGAGKTTLGKKLSCKLEMPFVDTDKQIEKECNKSISDIFKDFGENYFREIEQKIVLNILNNAEKPVVLSIGGGAFLNATIRKNIKEKAISIWLKIEISDIFIRIKKSKHDRPLIKQHASLSETESLYNKRQPFYEKSDIKVEIHKLTKNEVLDLTIKQLYLHLENEKSSY